jgi:GNAT superfamily N-acetyltransferase
MSEARVRDASADDAGAITSIGRRAMPVQYEGLVDPAAVDAAVAQIYSLKAVTECIERCLKAPDAEFLVAERSGQVVGFLHYDCFGPEPELHRLYLERAFRGGGIGTQLLEELHSRLPSRSEYMLLVLQGNDLAVHFYEQHGVHAVKLVDGLSYYGSDGRRLPPGYEAVSTRSHATGRLEPTRSDLV